MKAVCGISALKRLFGGGVDFDAEGRKRLEKSQADPTPVHEKERERSYDHVSMLYKNKQTNAAIYVGDHHVASSEDTLYSLGIRRIVNCTRPTSSSRGQLPNYFENVNDDFKYYEFPVGFTMRFLFWEIMI